MSNIESSPGNRSPRAPNPWWRILALLAGSTAAIALIGELAELLTGIPS